MSLIFRTFRRGHILLKCRNFHASSSLQDDNFKKFVFKLEGYNRLGILHDDLLNPELCPLVAEAVRRLPEEVQMQRTYRAIRAHQLELNNSLLPKEEWTKFEDDNFYLQPYLDEVTKEYEEMLQWEANH